jgi:hypothetical protein
MMPYFDPNGLARSNGFVEGLNNGRREGQEQGRKEGYNGGYGNGHQVGYHAGYQAGYQAGDAEGWDRAVETCNENLLQQLGYTREHVAQKEALAAQLALTGSLLKLTEEKLALRERELAASDAGDPDARLAALRDADQDKLHQLEQLHAEKRRDAVFINALCMTLVELTMTEGGTSEATWNALDHHYHQKVQEALAANALTAAPHLDPGFAQAHPQARQLLDNLLGSAAG